MHRASIGGISSRDIALGISLTLGHLVNMHPVTRYPVIGHLVKVHLVKVRLVKVHRKGISPEGAPRYRASL